VVLHGQRAAIAGPEIRARLALIAPRITECAIVAPPPQRAAILVLMSDGERAGVAHETGVRMPAADAGAGTLISKGREDGGFVRRAAVAIIRGGTGGRAVAMAARGRIRRAAELAVA